MLLPLFQQENSQLSWDSDHLPELPVLPLRNVVAFPYSMLPLSVGLARSVRLLEDTLDDDRLLVLVGMTDPSMEEPGSDGVYQTGTLAQIERALRTDDSGYQIVVRGLTRVRINKWLTEEPYLKAQVELYPEMAGD